jgi:hypothetical protein
VLHILSEALCQEGNALLAALIHGQGFIGISSKGTNGASDAYG